MNNMPTVEELKGYIEKGGYIEGVGRRKTAVARVRIFSKKGEKSNFTVNDSPVDKYFKTSELLGIVNEAFRAVEKEDFDISVHVKGGGQVAQAEAIRHGSAIALSLYDINLRKDLKALKYLRRDSRMKERKKPGLRGARRAPQWSKR